MFELTLQFPSPKRHSPSFSLEPRFLFPAQCSHAAVACYKRAMKKYPAAVHAWEWTGCAKIAVKLQGGVAAVVDKSVNVEDEVCGIDNEVAALMSECKKRGVVYYLVEDAGRTQIKAGSRTVLGVGPAPAHIVDEITGHLKLL